MVLKSFSSWCLRVDRGGGRYQLVVYAVHLGDPTMLGGRLGQQGMAMMAVQSMGWVELYIDLTPVLLYGLRCIAKG